MTPKTKRLRQFKFYFKQGEEVTILLEPGDRYEIGEKVIVIEGARATAKNLRFTYTYNLDDISMRKFTTWDEDDLPPVPRQVESADDGEIPFR